MIAKYPFNTSNKVIVTSEGLTIDGQVFDSKLQLEQYKNVLGSTCKTIEAGPPASMGHRNNLIHLFDLHGIYLTEHHASQLIESVNFIFVVAECFFPIERAFEGYLEIDNQLYRPEMSEKDIKLLQLNRDLPGEYSLTLGKIWIGISAKGLRDASGKRRPPRQIVRVSICF